MFQLHGCAPRGIVRDRRQQTGHALKPVRGGEDTVRAVLNTEVTTREHLFRVQVQLRGQGLSIVGTELRSLERIGPKCYEIVGTKACIVDVLSAMDVEWIRHATHRAHGPNLQQSRPNHRR